MVKSWLQPIFTIDNHRVGQLEDHGCSHWTVLINYSLGTNSTVKSFKQLPVAISTSYKVLQNLENRGATEKVKQFPSGRPAVKLTKGKRKQLVNATMDNDHVSLTKIAKKIGSSTDLCSESV